MGAESPDEGQYRWDHHQRAQDKDDSAGDDEGRLRVWPGFAEGSDAPDCRDSVENYEGDTGNLQTPTDYVVAGATGQDRHDIEVGNALGRK